MLLNLSRRTVVYSTVVITTLEAAVSVVSVCAHPLEKQRKKAVPPVCKCAGCVGYRDLRALNNFEQL